MSELSFDPSKILLHGDVSIPQLLDDGNDDDCGLDYTRTDYYDDLSLPPSVAVGLNQSTWAPDYYRGYEEEKDETGWFSQYQLEEEEHNVMNDDMGYLMMGEDYCSSTFQDTIDQRVREDVMMHGEMNDMSMEENFMNDSMKRSEEEQVFEEIVIDGEMQDTIMEKVEMRQTIYDYDPNSLFEGIDDTFEREEKCEENTGVDCSLLSHMDNTCSYTDSSISMSSPSTHLITYICRSTHIPPFSAQLYPNTSLSSTQSYIAPLCTTTPSNTYPCSTPFISTIHLSTLSSTSPPSPSYLTSILHTPQYSTDFSSNSPCSTPIQCTTTTNSISSPSTIQSPLHLLSSPSATPRSTSPPESPSSFCQASDNWNKEHNEISYKTKRRVLNSMKRDQKKASVCPSNSIYMYNGKKKTKKVKISSSHRLRMQRYLNELFDMEMELSDNCSEGERLLFCALYVNCLKPSMKNITAKIAHKKVLREELSLRKAAVKFGLNVKAFLREHAKILHEAEEERQRLECKVINSGGPTKKLRITNEMKRIIEEEQMGHIPTIQENGNTSTSTNVTETQFFIEEEEIIDTTPTQDELERVFSKVFGNLFDGWVRRRGVSQTVVTLGNAISEGVRPSLKHTPSGDLKLDIEKDVIPFYRRIVDEFKKDSNLCGLVKKMKVVVSEPLMCIKRTKKM